ncbi:nitroreductase family deazaflavin-dependent oxidoreductase [Streptomyces sp. BHT-5-2]|uniref:nitroreductase family deazaflavin-dependent oxidoreductase n=1 Tax=Streptomyces sp. BHT-5-2 TaxID=2866715 RepID=UPI001C8D31BE|nr:nitroreductase family deazaflavin-dependent oxidoreductase [Streptomyces sp. BHT-5-2]QZL04278.1 nitroreductase family deazaflavin-dependent oxidoreductase [Streptomyces sp. BHT-5-2]
MPETPTPSSAIVEIGTRILRTRWLMRAPIRLYRARLGFLFGSRTLMLEHTGRRSGATRYVVLEVIDHPTPDTYVVASGLGDRARWFRNIQANPHVHVTIGTHGPASATARVIPQDEADAALRTYISRHPRAWERFKSVLETTLGTPVTERNTPLPMVGLCLSRSPCRVWPI